MSLPSGVCWWLKKGWGPVDVVSICWRQEVHPATKTFTIWYKTASILLWDFHFTSSVVAVVSSDLCSNGKTKTVTFNTKTLGPQDQDTRSSRPRHKVPRPRQYLKDRRDQHKTVTLLTFMTNEQNNEHTYVITKTLHWQWVFSPLCSYVDRWSNACEIKHLCIKRKKLY